MTDIMEARRKAFDAWYAKNRGTLGCGTYKDDLELWNAALDSVCVELPMPPDPRGGYSDYEYGISRGIDFCRESIERAGLKVKP